jgi:hypothetical protein
MKIKSYQQFNESKLMEMETEMSATLRKSLDDLGQGLDTDQAIISMIEHLGFKHVTSKPVRTADHVFTDKETGVTYLSFTTGYVRYNRDSKSRYSSADIVTKAPIVNTIIPDVRDRLLLILRRALKLRGYYSLWAKKKLPLKEFLHQYRGALTGMNYGL